MASIPAHGVVDGDGHVLERFVAPRSDETAAKVAGANVQPIDGIA